MKPLRAVAAPLLCASILALSSCVSAGNPTRAAAPDGATGSRPVVTVAGRPAAPESLSARLDRLLFMASPGSLAEVEVLLGGTEAGRSEYGRALLYAASRFRAILYSDLPHAPESLDPPMLNPLVRAFEEVKAGRYPDSALRETSPLCRLVATLSLVDRADSVTRASAEADLALLEKSGKTSLVLPWLRGILAERDLDYAKARARYADALALSSDFYRAKLCVVRIALAEEREEEARSLCLEVLASRPESLDAAKALARMYYDSGQYAEADPLVQTILAQEPGNDAFMLVRAHILIERGNYLQASPLLDAYANRNAKDPFYLYLKAVYLWGERKRKAEAITFIDAALLSRPGDARLSTLKARILIESSAPGSQDRLAARAILESILIAHPDNRELLETLCRESLSSGDYKRAQTYLDSLLERHPAFSDWALMTDVASSSGQAARAISWARSWYGAQPDSEAALVAYLRALVSGGQNATALELIGKGLSGKASSSCRSSLFYYRSRLAAGSEPALSDLRSSLMEDPRNFLAVMAMVDVYISQRDPVRAQYYLRQAQALNPAAPELASRQRSLDRLGIQP